MSLATHQPPAPSPLPTPPVDSTKDKDNWSASVYRTNASFVYSAAFTTPVLSLLAPQPGERVLDLGAGSGELTLEIAKAVQAEGQAGTVVGVDKSADLLSKARELTAAGGVSGVEWVERDGHDLEGVEGGFDAAFSNAALHWMKEDPEKVARNVYDRLKPGGRYAAEMGGHLNMVAVRSHLHTILTERGHDPAALDPWYFPTPAAYRNVLESAGFRVESIELVPRITALPTGLDGWLRTFGFAFLEHLGAEEKEEVIGEVCRRCAVDMESEEGWVCMYVRLRFKACKD